MSKSLAVKVETLEPRAYLAAQLITDVNPVTGDTSPTHTVAAGATAFFVRGQELWKTDGTVQGSGRVPTPLAPLASTFITPSGVLNPVPGAGIVAYVTRTADGTWSVLRSDGTAAGTFVLTQGVTSPHATFHFYADGPSLYWFAHYYDANNSGAPRTAGIWKSDGTAAGTRQVLSLADGYDFMPSATTFSGGQFFFLRRDGANLALWRSDGTAAGTAAAVANFYPYTAPAFSATPARLVATAGRFYAQLFAGASGSTNSYALVTSDGTAAGTSVVRSLATHGGDLVGLNGKAYFRNTQSGMGGYELWSSDGTAAGTTRLVDLLPNGNGTPTNLTVVGNRIYFAARSVDGEFFDRVWVSDGTAAGTTVLGPVTASRTAASSFTGAGGNVFFEAGSDVWRTDGTPAGTGKATPPDATYRHRITPFGAGALVAAAHPIHGDELWYTQGTAASTRVIDLTPDTFGAGFGDPVEFNGAVHFIGMPGFSPTNSNSWTSSLIKTDGTAAGTAVVRTNLTGIENPVVSGGRLFFPAFASESGIELFSSDGTAVGTGLLKDLNTYPREGSDPSTLTDVNGTLYFLADGFAGNTRYLWRSDGTEAGTVQVSDTLTFVNRSNPVASELRTAGGTLYVVGSETATGMELYKVDAAGAVTLVKDLRPGAESSLPVMLGELNGRLLFSASADGGWYRQLWITDGTDAGTVQLGDTAVGAGPWYSNFRVYDTASLDGRFYFYGGHDSPDTGLWSTDGTPQGTALVSRHPSVNDLGAAGGRLYFTTEVGGHPQQEELFVSDGTAAGTRALRRFEYQFVQTDDRFVAHAGRVFFTAKHPAYGRELWSTDGTPEGTVMDGDLNPGPADGAHGLFRTNLGGPGGTLLFAGVTPQHGEEVRKWVAPATPAPAAVVQRLTFHNHSAADGFDPAANAADDRAVANTVALLPGVASGGEHRTRSGRGLNGIMVDVANLPAGAVLSADDFTFGAGTGPDPSSWAPLPGRPAISVRRGAGAYSSDRVTLTWPDGTAARNTWLQVTVKPNARTGLTSPDVFYFGNLAGDMGNSPDGRVDPIDFRIVRSAVGSPMPFLWYDFNADGRVNVLDLAIVRANLGRSLKALTAPPAAAQSAAGPARALEAIAPATRADGLRPRRGAYAGVTAQVLATP